MSGRITCFVVLILYAVTGFSQKIENVDFKLVGNVVTVTYDLVDGAEDYSYDVDIKFKLLNGQVKVPHNAYGDLNGVYPGKNKQIIWDVIADKQEIIGEASAIVRIVKSHYHKPYKPIVAKAPRSNIKVSNGPQNVYKSMILPGLGDYYVNSQPRKLPVYVMTSYMMCLSFAFWTWLDDDKESAKGCLYAAAGIWTSDVLYVLIKGAHNKHKYNKSVSINASPIKLYFLPQRNNSFCVGLTTSF